MRKDLCFKCELPYDTTVLNLAVVYKPFGWGNPIHEIYVCTACLY